jgi:ATP-dependent DNA helicase RecG
VLIHTDYTAPGNIVIEHKTDAFSFSNPGTLLVSLQQYYQGGISECRNPNLQKMFLMIGGAEKAGSGVNKILAGWEYAHWRRPYLKVMNQPDRLVLELPMTSFLPEETLETLRTLFGNEVDALGKNELTILATCHIEGEVTNSRLQFLVGLHRTDITRILQDLCKQAYLIPVNKGRWTTYHLNTSIASKVDTSTSKVDTSANKVDTSANKVDTQQNNVDSFDTRIDNNKKITPKSRLKKEELESLILEACLEEHVSIVELSKIVNKDIKYLKNKVIPAMIKDGKLERLYPNINHPHQAYKAR